MRTSDAWRAAISASIIHPVVGPNLPCLPVWMERLGGDICCARSVGAPDRGPIRKRQAHLFSDRTSTATMKANQLRLWFASMAYVLICALRRTGLADT